MTDAPKDYAPGDNPLEASEGPEARSAKEKAAETAAQLRRTVEERAAQAREWAMREGEVLRGQVTERPLTTVGISAGAAFAAGLVLGVLLASSRR
ncbi:MAG TPA: hypothetical protein VL358_02405 [Caulobacteraceae bacterium]|jgi:ElaB/YqjD/DUF883 family membrane-anchored ribosome-binding protein|nr:hypothetical protein [Caulobacteraceae bacterium]